nr:CopG family transcriptional regulator [uncultured Desulfobacter sp.]
MKKDKREITLKSYVTQKEYSQIKLLAKQTGFSVSEYIRRILTGQKIESRLDQEAFLSALKVNADLGRLGGLLKYYLAQGFKNVPPSEIRKVLHDIEDRQRQLRPVISKIRDMV